MPDATPVTAIPAAPATPAAVPAVPATPEAPRIPLTARQKLDEQMRKLAAERKAAAAQGAPGTAGDKPAEVKPAQTASDEAKDKERRADAIARVRREEAKVLAAKEALRAERATWQTENAAMMQKARVHDALAAAVGKKDVLEYLRLGGFAGEDAAKAMLKPDSRTPDEIFAEREQKLRADLKAEREALDRQAAAKAEQDGLERQMKAAHKELREMIDSNPEKYEFLSSYPGAIPEVWKFIEDHFAATIDKKTGRGVVMDFEEALDLAEKALEEQEVAKHRSSKKIRAALEREAAEKKAAETPPAVAGRAGAAKPSAVSSAKSGSTQPTNTPPVEPRRAKPYNLADHVKELRARVEQRRDS